MNFIAISDRIKATNFKGGLSLKDEKDLTVENELSGMDKNAEEKVLDVAALSEDKLSAALDKSAAYGDNALNDELEKLAQTFKAELQKAQSMTEEELIKKGIIIPEYEDEEGAIPAEELCVVCGEKRKDKSRGENYEYCKDCREAMKHYPFGAISIIALIVTVLLAVLSVYSFSLDFIPYNTVKEANGYLNENKLDSAMSAYDGAISAFEDEGITAKWLYLKTSKILFNTMPGGVNSMTDIVTRLDKALSVAEAKIPIYGEYANLREETLVLYGTMQSFYEVVSNEEYVGFENMSDELYEQVMTEIGSIIDSEVSVLSKDGETTAMLPANEAMVRFCQYMYAYSAGRYDDSYVYMKKVFETEPSYLWLYAYELGIVELQKGNYEDAEFYADAMLNVNAEASDGYSLKSAVARVTGNADEALKYAEKGLSYDSSNVELVRAKAMAYAAKGDFENAKKIVDEAMSVTSYGMLHMTAAVIENELGNKDAVESYLNELEQNDLELSDKLQSYFDGEITAVQVFTEGTGDVE